MADYLHDIEPFYGWLDIYDHAHDPKSPFHEVQHSQFYFDRSINRIPAHPLWDTIGSESLLVKILYANYLEGYAIIELFGEWNDLYDNDFKLLAENCLTYLIDHGVKKFILVCENVFHAYVESDDYYEALQEEIEDGWMCLIKPRANVLEEFQDYGLLPYFYQSPQLDSLQWRKFKPHQLYQLVNSRLSMVLG